MAFGKRQVEEIVTEETKIWVCKSEECNCWMRDNFTSSDTSETPACPICKSEMEQSTKVLQVVENHSKQNLS